MAATLKAIPFVLKPSAREALTEIEFIPQSKDNARLDDVFVFPAIAHKNDRSRSIKNLQELLSVGDHVLLRGDDRSGKTVMCRQLFLHLVDEHQPALLLQGTDIGRRTSYAKLIQTKFKEQFTGEHRYWDQQTAKTLILDDFTGRSPLQFLDFAKEHFSRIVISVSEDDYISYFVDELKLTSVGQKTPSGGCEFAGDPPRPWT